MTPRAPAVPLALALLAGLLLPGPRAPLALALAALALAGALGVGLLARLRLATVLALAGFVALGFAARDLRTMERERATLRRLYELVGESSSSLPRRVTGRLRAEPAAVRDATVLTLEVDSMRQGGVGFPCRGGLRVSVRGSYRDALKALAEGDRVRLWTTLRPPTGLRNPGGFDAARYFEREGIDLLGSTKSALLVERLDRGRGAGPALSRLRSAALSRLSRSLGDGPSFAIVAALVAGDRSHLEPDLERRFQRAGVFHVMAISGAHVAVLALFVHWLLRRVGVDEAPALVALLVLLPVYAGFCGARAPVLRAVVMASLLVVARLASLDRPHVNALGLGALALLVWDPASLGAPGFQLSFAAMASILALSPYFAEELQRLGGLKSALALSLSAQVGVVPFQAWHFLRLAPVAPFASLAAVPLAAMVLVLGIALVALGGVPVVGGLFALLTHGAVALLVATAELFARIPFASVDTGRPSVAWMLAYGAAVAALAAGPRRLRRAALAAALGLVVLLLPGTPSPPGTLTLTAIDVGHGDALLLRLPGGRDVLVDGGGAPGSSFDVGAAIVLPYLRASGVRSLDAVVLTHTDYDHLGGLLTVVEEMRIGEIWEGPPRFDRTSYRTLRERASRRGVAFRRLEPGTSFAWGGVRFEVLAAGGLPGLRPEKSNDQSVVLRLVYGRSRLLLTGDAEGAVEEALAREPSRSRADVLKVAHHGSRTSTSAAWLDAVAPRLAVISGRRSAGRPLPSLEVLERLDGRGIETLRTDVSGTVTVRMDAEARLSVETFLESGSR